MHNRETEFCGGTGRPLWLAASFCTLGMMLVMMVIVMMIVILMVLLMIIMTIKMYGSTPVASRKLLHLGHDDDDHDDRDHGNGYDHDDGVDDNYGNYDAWV